MAKGDPKAYSSLSSAERERMLREAQALIRELQPLEPTLQRIYDRVKYSFSGGGWPQTREVAADLANSRGLLEAELADVIRELREFRARESEQPTRRSAKATTRRPTRDQVRVEVWQERDRLHIGIQEKATGEYVVSWWDDEARQMFEDGFFLRGSKLENSVLDYAEEQGLLAKS